MVFFIEYLLFFLKMITIVIGILLLLSGIIALATSGKGKKHNTLRVKQCNHHFGRLKDQLHKVILDKAEYRKLQKLDKKAARRNNNRLKPRVFILTFDGDMKASAVESLREEISAILLVANTEDEVVVCLESGGGTIHGYGLAASQLQRLREKHIPLTVIVDKIAASGGYLMACVANTIIAAPFAIIGSIGVITQVPNFYRFLKKNDIDFEQFTAGNFKRTLSVFAENSPEGREKTQEMVNTAHNLFKSYIQQHRMHLDVDKVATGEYWHATEALVYGLVDRIMTSDEYLLGKIAEANLYALSYDTKVSFSEKLSQIFQNTLDSVIHTFSRSTYPSTARDRTPLLKRPIV